MLSAMAQAVPTQASVTDDELKAIAGHLLRHQEADGSWAWSSAPAKNRPPPFFESDEVATLLGYMALGPQEKMDNSPEREARTKAAAWLAKQKPNDTTQAAAYRLLVKVRAGEKTLDADIADFLRRQNKDGGWGRSLRHRQVHLLNLAGQSGGRAQRVEFCSPRKEDTPAHDSVAIKRHSGTVSVPSFTSAAWGP